MPITSPVAVGVGAAAAACFFGAYAVAQLPIGVALDLHGPRKVQSMLAIVAAAGFHAVVAGVARERVRGGVAVEQVAARAAAGVLDQRAPVIVVQQRHGDVAERQRGQVLIGQVIGDLVLVVGIDERGARARVDGHAVDFIATDTSASSISRRPCDALRSRRICVAFTGLLNR